MGTPADIFSFSCLIAEKQIIQTSYFKEHSTEGMDQNYKDFIDRGYRCCSLSIFKSFNFLRKLSDFVKFSNFLCINY